MFKIRANTDSQTRFKIKSRLKNRPLVGSRKNTNHFA